MFAGPKGVKNRGQCEVIEPEMMMQSAGEGRDGLVPRKGLHGGAGVATPVGVSVRPPMALLAAVSTEPSSKALDLTSETR